MTGQAHSFSEEQLECNQNQMPWENRKRQDIKSRDIKNFSAGILRVAGRLLSFKLVLDEKAGRELPGSSRLEFSDKISAKNFALSDADDKTS